MGAVANKVSSEGLLGECECICHITYTALPQNSILLVVVIVYCRTVCSRRLHIDCIEYDYIYSLLTLPLLIFQQLLVLNT